MPLFAASQQMDFYNTSLGIFKRHLKAVRRQIGLAGEKVQPKHFFIFFFFFITIKQKFQLPDAQVATQRLCSPLRRAQGCWRELWGRLWYGGGSRIQPWGAEEYSEWNTKSLSWFKDQGFFWHQRYMFLRAGGFAQLNPDIPSRCSHLARSPPSSRRMARVQIDLSDHRVRPST